MGHNTSQRRGVFRKHIRRFANIAGYTAERVRADQFELNVKAAEKMAKLHDALSKHGYDGHDLEVYLVRLLFCMFADDTGIFPQDSFFRYIEKSKPDGSDLSERIGKLFEALNMPDDVRAKRTLLSDELKKFHYINGGLFKDILPMADFDAKMRQTLIDCVNFDWNTISPAIFGAMFQGVMDKNQRRELGAHYTSEENILKLINPLFMDELWREFDRVKTDPTALDRFHDKIARLKFLDPACGCGNFLIVTYRELRELELEVLIMKSGTDQMTLDITPMLKVGVEQFYGIEVEDFPCQIAQVGMWLIDHQMNLRVSEQFGQYYARLPLTQSATIVHGNALRIDWENIVPKRELSFILGNPPFVGYAYANAEQKADMAQIFPKSKTLDYVCAWYKKATDMMKQTQIKTAFVSTNSVAQGEQPTILWKPLFEQGVFINFGVPTFKWSNEAKGKAAVHCVIIGFSCNKTEPNINQYLLEAPTVFIEKRAKPLCNVPEMFRGSDPVDGGNLIIESDEYEKYVNKEPVVTKYIRQFMMGNEFLNNKKRYCLWLEGVPPSEFRKMPLTMERIEKCRQMRIKSSRSNTLRAAETPMLFESNRQPDTDYIAIPKVSSEQRRYIPIGYLSNNIIAGDKLFTIPNATLYHFGILTSNVHNAWMRAVAGRLEMRYSYSNTLVYNNFPWSDVTDEQKSEIEKLAQAVLDARDSYAGESLADMYGKVHNGILMGLDYYPILKKAHQELDRAVMKLYGFSVKDTSEAECVARLMERYRELVESHNK
ncbi:MAG: N-6 DNA methylase [Oscillospiraceae bacterium]|nr:N-6 DNA methylase [Oscillospiraceae bacterium]